jgi:ATP diphosphatase
MVKASREIEDLLGIMTRLRDPESGCPWDLKQGLSTIAPYTLEEAYEVADAAERGDMKDLCEELGDLLLQIAFFAQMAKEDKKFDFGDVVLSITSKLIRRHPHIFGDKTANSPEDVKKIWDQVKEQEKPNGETLLGDVPLALPALARAVKLQQKAGTVGFDWNDPKAVLSKIREELDEFEAELAKNDKTAEKEEFGDLLFALANLARHRKIDPEQALRDANAKFARRFSSIEAELKSQGRTPQAATLDEMEALWQKAKLAETAILNS